MCDSDIWLEADIRLRYTDGVIVCMHSAAPDWVNKMSIYAISTGVALEVNGYLTQSRKNLYRKESTKRFVKWTVLHDITDCVALLLLYILSRPCHDSFFSRSCNADCEINFEIHMESVDAFSLLDVNCYQGVRHQQHPWPCDTTGFC